MSHEIRTPLNAIVGFAKILPEITDEMERASIINIIDTNSDQLLMLINDILDLSKIEAGTIEFVDIPANLTDLCQNIYCTLIEKTAPGVQLVFEGAFDNLVTLCDPGRLSQVIVNLITNAIKFTKEGFIRYGYRLRRIGSSSMWRIPAWGFGGQTEHDFYPFHEIEFIHCGNGARTGHLPDDRRTAAWENMGRIETGRRFDIPV